MNGKTEGKSEIENLLAAILIGGARHAASSDGSFKVIVVMLFEECFDLAGEELEQFLVRGSDHHVAGDRDFILCEVESAIALEVDRADPEVGATEIDGQIQALVRS